MSNEKTCVTFVGGPLHGEQVYLTSPRDRIDVCGDGIQVTAYRPFTESPWYAKRQFYAPEGTTWPEYMTLVRTLPYTRGHGGRVALTPKTPLVAYRQPPMAAPMASTSAAVSMSSPDTVSTATPVTATM